MRTKAWNLLAIDLFLLMSGNVAVMIGKECHKMQEMLVNIHLSGVESHYDS